MPSPDLALAEKDTTKSCIFAFPDRPVESLPPNYPPGIPPDLYPYNPVDDWPVIPVTPVPGTDPIPGIDPHPTTAPPETELKTGLGIYINLPPTANIILRIELSYTTDDTWVSYLIVRSTLTGDPFEFKIRYYSASNIWYMLLEGYSSLPPGSNFWFLAFGDEGVFQVGELTLPINIRKTSLVHPSTVLRKNIHPTGPLPPAYTDVLNYQFPTNIRFG